MAILQPYKAFYPAPYLHPGNLTGNTLAPAGLIGWNYGAGFAPFFGVAFRFFHQFVSNANVLPIANQFVGAKTSGFYPQRRGRGRAMFATWTKPPP